MSTGYQVAGPRSSLANSRQGVAVNTLDPGQPATQSVQQYESCPICNRLQTWGREQRPERQRSVAVMTAWAKVGPARGLKSVILTGHSQCYEVQGLAEAQMVLPGVPEAVQVSRRALL